MSKARFMTFQLPLQLLVFFGVYVYPWTFQPGAVATTAPKPRRSV